MGLSQDWNEALTGQFALIRVGSLEFCFHKADAKSPVSTGGCVAYWEVDDFDKTINDAVSIGGAIYRGPLRIHDSPRWMAQIKDPYGNVFGIEGFKTVG
jgi:predicted enzyme related to lactoylglutathione lyase